MTQDNTLLSVPRAPILAPTLPHATAGDPPSPPRPARLTAAGAKTETGARVKSGIDQEVGMDVHRAEASGRARSVVSP